MFEESMGPYSELNQDPNYTKWDNWGLNPIQRLTMNMKIRSLFTRGFPGRARVVLNISGKPSEPEWLVQCLDRNGHMWVAGTPTQQSGDKVARYINRVRRRFEIYEVALLVVIMSPAFLLNGHWLNGLLAFAVCGYVAWNTSGILRRIPVPDFFTKGGEK